MILYDGHDLESVMVVGDPEITWHTFSPETVDVPGRDGTVVRDVTLGPASVSMAVAVEGEASERRHRLSILGSWLRVDSARPLVLPDTPDRYYLAVPDGALDMRRAIRGELSRLTFRITEPAAYGKRQNVTVPSGGTAQVVVGGTYPTGMKIEGAVTRNSSSNVWGIRLDEGDFIHIDTGSNSSRAISIDTDSRVAKVSGSVALPTLDSDWLHFDVGKHTLRNDQGAGSVTVSWVERWL